MNVITWIRNYAFNEEKLTKFEEEHYTKFEKALQESDLSVFVYDNFLRGEIIVRQYEELHPVTPKNLISFRKLRRNERRAIKNKIAIYDTKQ